MTKAPKSTAAGTHPEASLLDFKLPNGKKLGDATREEVLKAAEHYARQGNDMTTKGRRLMSLHDRMPGQQQRPALAPNKRHEPTSSTMPEAARPAYKGE